MWQHHAAGAACQVAVVLTNVARHVKPRRCFWPLIPPCGARPTWRDERPHAFKINLNNSSLRFDMPCGIGKHNRELTCCSCMLHAATSFHPPPVHLRGFSSLRAGPWCRSRSQVKTVNLHLRGCSTRRVEGSSGSPCLCHNNTCKLAT